MSFNGFKPVNGMAIVSLVLGLVGLFSLGSICGVLAIILASVVKKKGNTSGLVTGG